MSSILVWQDSVATVTLGRRTGSSRGAMSTRIPAHRPSSEVSPAPTRNATLRRDPMSNRIPCLDPQPIPALPILSHPVPQWAGSQEYNDTFAPPSSFNESNWWARSGVNESDYFNPSVDEKYKPRWVPPATCPCSGVKVTPCQPHQWHVSDTWLVGSTVPGCGGQCSPSGGAADISRQHLSIPSPTAVLVPPLPPPVCGRALWVSGLLAEDGSTPGRPRGVWVVLSG